MNPKREKAYKERALEWVAHQPPKVLLENPYLKELVSSLEDYCDFYEPDMIKTERGCRLLNALEVWEEK